MPEVIPPLQHECRIPGSQVDTLAQIRTTQCAEQQSIDRATCALQGPSKRIPALSALHGVNELLLLFFSGRQRLPKNERLYGPSPISRGKGRAQYV